MFVNVRLSNFPVTALISLHCMFLSVHMSFTLYILSSFTSNADANNFSYVERSVSNKLTNAFVSKKSVLSAFSDTVTLRPIKSVAVAAANPKTPVM